jgi:hypothetical protein
VGWWGRGRGWAAAGGCGAMLAAPGAGAYSRAVRRGAGAGCQPAPRAPPPPRPHARGAPEHEERDEAAARGADISQHDLRRRHSCCRCAACAARALAAGGGAERRWRRGGAARGRQARAGALPRGELAMAGRLAGVTEASLDALAPRGARGVAPSGAGPARGRAAAAWRARGSGILFPIRGADRIDYALGRAGGRAEPRAGVPLGVLAGAQVPPAPHAPAPAGPPCARPGCRRRRLPPHTPLLGRALLPSAASAQCTGCRGAGRGRGPVGAAAARAALAAALPARRAAGARRPCEAN